MPLILLSFRIFRAWLLAPIICEIGRGHDEEPKILLQEQLSAPGPARAASNAAQILMYREFETVG
jgi:hypothetical protein